MGYYSVAIGAVYASYFLFSKALKMLNSATHLAMKFE